MMRNLCSFPTVYHLHYSDKQFENYDQKTARSEDTLYRDRKLTNPYRGVRMHVEDILNTLFFTSGNST